MDQLNQCGAVAFAAAVALAMKKQKQVPHLARAPASLHAVSFLAYVMGMSPMFARHRCQHQLFQQWL